eukprot:355876-Chlamydomonas_euryale.AAC.3
MAELPKRVPVRPRQHVKRGAADRVALWAARPDVRQRLVRAVQVHAQEPEHVGDAHCGRAAEAGGAVHVHTAALKAERAMHRTHGRRQRPAEAVRVKVTRLRPRSMGGEHV